MILFPGPVPLHHPSHVSSPRDLHHQPPGPPPAGSTKHLQFQQRGAPGPAPAHSSSLKKPNVPSIEEALKRHSQLQATPPGFPLGLPGLLSGTGLSPHMAAALASGRYPPGFMPTGPSLPPGFSAPRSSFFPSSTQNSQMNAQAVAQAASASAKLQELQNRVMASSRQSGLNLSQITAAMQQASGNPGPSIPGSAQGLRPSSSAAAASQYADSLLRLASAANPNSKNMPGYPGPK